jgi:hypothetical protein
MPETKKVRITLAALTRVEYTEVLEVPADMTDAELDALVDKRYDNVDGGDYEDDPEFWERGTSTGWEAVSSITEPTFVVTRDASGDLHAKAP